MSSFRVCCPLAQNLQRDILSSVSSSHDSPDFTLNDREFILKRLQEVTSDLQAQLDRVKVEVHEQRQALVDSVKSFEASVTLMRDATAKAADEAARLSHLVQKLSCLEPDTDPAIPCALESAAPAAHRRSFHSSEELEEFSEVTSATIKAIMPAVVDAVRKSRSNFPIQFSTPGGWAVKLSAVGAVIVALVFVGWWLLKHATGVLH